MSRVVLWLGALVCVPFGMWIMHDQTGLAAMTRTGVLAMALTFGGPFVGRVVGIVVDGGTMATYRVAALELAMALLAAAALVRDARQLGGRHP